MQVPKMQCGAKPVFAFWWMDVAAKEQEPPHATTKTALPHLHF